MKGYIRDRKRQDKISRWTGIGLTAAIHVVVVCSLVLSGFQKTYPPPPEKIIVEFVDIEDLEMPEVRPDKRGDVESDVVDPERPVEEVIAAQSPLVSTTKNDATASNPTPTGDVEIPETPETPLDPKAIFPGHSQRDTSNTSQGAKEPTGSITPGQPAGGSQGSTDGSANARVEGRQTTFVPSLPKVKNGRGTVVVDIWVDRDGKVVRTSVSPNNGSTTMEPELVRIARETAAKCLFKPNPDDAVAERHGTVTCNFVLTQ